MAKKYIDADRLNAKIERYIKDVKDAGERLTPNMGFFDVKLSGIYDVMSIVASLQQEQPVETSQEFRQEVINFCQQHFAELHGDMDTIDIVHIIAHHFAEWGAEHLRDTTKMIAEGLEEAAFTYENDLWESGFKDSGYSPQEVNDAFKAGAEWQKAKMMEEAIEGVARPDDCEIWVNLVGYGYKFKDGDKVRVIVIKEDEI